MKGYVEGENTTRNPASQLHHFAAYFHIGATLGNSIPVLKTALDRSGDWDETMDRNKVRNWGNFFLRIMAADLGYYYQYHSLAFCGSYITEQLKAGVLPTKERLRDFGKNYQTSP